MSAYKSSLQKKLLILCSADMGIPYYAMGVSLTSSLSWIPTFLVQKLDSADPGP